MIKRLLIFVALFAAGLAAVAVTMPQIPFYLLLRWQAAQIDNPWVERVPEGVIRIETPPSRIDSGERRELGGLTIHVPAGYAVVGDAAIADIVLFKAADGASIAVAREQGLASAWPQDVQDWGYARDDIAPEASAGDEWALQRAILLSRPSDMSWRNHPRDLVRASVFMALKALDAPASEAGSPPSARWLNHPPFKGVQLGDPASGGDTVVMLFTPDNQRYRLVAQGMAQAAINAFIANLEFRSPPEP